MCDNSIDTRSDAQLFPVSLMDFLSEECSTESVKLTPQPESGEAAGLHTPDGRDYTASVYDPIGMDFMLAQASEHLDMELATSVDNMNMDQEPTSSDTTNPEDVAAAIPVSQPLTSKASEMDQEIKRCIESKEPTILLLNFPDAVPVIGVDSTGTSKLMQGWPLPDDMRGEMKIFDSGRVVISFAKNDFEMSPALTPSCSQEVVRVARDEDTQLTYMSSLGLVQQSVNMIPLEPVPGCRCSKCVAHHSSNAATDR